MGARRPSELELLLGDAVLNSEEAEIQVRERLGLAVPLRVLTPTRLSEMISEARRAGTRVVETMRDGPCGWARNVRA